MLFATLEQARQNPAWHRGDLVITQRGIQHALVRGQGPDVILLHGITDNAHTWNAVQERLAGVARTHALDLPGHGLSDIPGTLPTPPEMADWVAAYMDAARVDSAVIVGWSLGGATALAFAARHGRRATALVLEGAVAFDMPVPALLRPLRWPGIGELTPFAGLTEAGRRAALVGNYARGFRPSDDVLRRYFLGWSVRARAAYIRGLVRAKSWRGIDKLLGEVRAPAIVLHGEEDGLVPVRFAHELAARLGCADVRILPKTGHAPHIEQVDATVSAIEAALHRRA